MTAANILAESMKDILKKLEEQTNAVVLGIPRGGVITADVSARKQACKLDIIIPRKLTDPDNNEYAIGAVMEDGITYLDESVDQLYITKEYIETEKLYQIEEIKRRTKLYRRDTSSAAGDYYGYLKDRTVILAEDRAATDATIIVAARSIENKFNPERLVIALPVAPKDTVSLLKQEANTLEVITTLPAIFTRLVNIIRKLIPWQMSRLEKSCEIEV